MFCLRMPILGHQTRDADGYRTVPSPLWPIPRLPVAMKPNTALLVVSAIAGVVAQKAAIGAESARRFLLLHGRGTTAGAFLNSATARGAKDFLSGVPRRVDAGGILIPPNWQYSTLDAGSGDGGWWADDKFKGVDASIAAIESAIVDDQAVGIIGHEQGAVVAALCAARSALGEGPPLKFAILCGARMPTADAYVELLHRLRDTPGASIPTLHCMSKTDGVHPSESAEELAACFAPSSEILWHERGSAMPPPGWWEQTRGFPERVTGGNRWVTQYGGPFYYAKKKSS